jgi:hypothetical protein
MENVGIPTLGPFGIFNGHLVYFIAVWSTLLSFGISFQFWYF